MFKIVRRARIVLMFVFALVLAACGGTASNATPVGPQVINVTQQEFSYQPAEIALKVGQPVKIMLKNNGTLTHDFSSMDAVVTQVNSQGAMHAMDNMAGMDLKLHVAVEVGQSGSIEFTPTQAGTYTFFCTVEGHKDAGMVGKLVVTP